MSDSSANIDPFTASMREFFASVAGGAIADQGVGLNFDVLPLAIGVADVCDDAGHYSPARATEFFSRQIANHSAHASGGFHYTNLATLSDLLQFHLTGSALFYGRPDRAPELVEADRRKFEAYIAQARKLFDGTLASLAPSAPSFLPSTPIPGDWANPDAADNWRSFQRNFKAAPPQDSAAGAAQQTRVTLPIRSFDPEAIKHYIDAEKWKNIPPIRFPIPGHGPLVTDPARDWATVFNTRATQEQLARPLTDRMLQGAAGRHALRANAAMSLLDGGALDKIEFAPDFAGEQDLPRLADADAIDPAAVFQASSIFKAGMIADAVTTSVTKPLNEVDVSFEYMFVKIERPWIFWPMLMDSNWYIEGKRRGELADNTALGSLSLVPERMIVVRKLRIDAQFSDQDRAAIGNAFALGPFRLTEIDSQAGSLRAPGMQVIGYIDRSMPPLPPRTDPAIVV